MNKTSTKEFSIGWIIYFFISVLIVVVVGITENSSLPLLISSTFGVMYVLLIAKEKRIAFIFGIINVVIYGIILITQKLYGGALYNISYSIPMLIWGYIKWKKVENEENSGIKFINKSKKIALFFVILLIILIYAYILKKVGGTNNILDSMTSILGFLGIYLMSNKYMEQWVVWVISNVANLVLWIILSIQNTNNLPIMLMWGIYLINSIYGYETWSKKYFK